MRRSRASEAPVPDVTRSVEVDVLDPLTFLGASDREAQAEQGANETIEERLERVWNYARPPGWVSYDFDPGAARMQATTLAQAALQEMWLTADSAAGMVMCTPDGVVQYYDTHFRLTADRRTVPQYTFTDDDDYGATTPMICANQFSVIDDQAQVINWVGIAAKDGTQEQAVDDFSYSFYGPKTTHRNDLIHAEGQTFSKEIAETFLSRVTRQSVVISPLVFDVLHSDVAWEAAHFLDIGDRVQVHRSADGNQLDVTAEIDFISHNIQPTSWTCTIQLAPGTQRTAYARWGTARWGLDTCG